MRLISWLEQLSARPSRQNRGRRWPMAEVELLEDRTQLTPMTYAATDLPLLVGDPGSTGPTVSIIHVADDFVVHDVNVQLNIEHTWDSDLDVVLIAPDGTRVELFSAIGGNSDNFTETTLDQQAGQLIVNASAPFTGTFRPSGNLSGLNGQHSPGDWQLEITDVFLPLDSGTLLSWSLTLLEGHLQPASVTYVATDVPIRVPPQEPDTQGVTYSVLYVPDDFVVQDVNVQLSIEHNTDSELTAGLFSPDFTFAYLFSGIGGNGVNFTDTVFDQQSSNSLSSASAPFTGIFQPIGDFSVFNGKHSQGYWYLGVLDSVEGNFGTLLSWSLTLDSTIPDVGGTLSTAATVSPAATTGSIASLLDVDLYSIDLPAGLNVTARLDVVSGSNLNGHLRVFDATGNPLELDESVSTSGGQQVTFLPPTQGRYYIGVSSIGNETYSPITGVAVSGSTSGEFDLRVTTDATHDFTEFPASNWRTIADGGVASLSEDQTHVLTGSQSLKFVTTGGGDTGVSLSTGGSAWDLSQFVFLEFFAFADNPNPYGFQGQAGGGDNQPWIELTTTSGTILLRPREPLMRNHEWQLFRVPLSGDGVWQRTSSGVPNLDAVTELKIHQDTWDYGFTMYYDGVKFSRFGAFSEPTMGLGDPQENHDDSGTSSGSSQIDLTPTQEPGVYVLTLAEAGAVTVSLSNDDGSQFAGELQLLTSDRRLLRQQNFDGLMETESATLTEQLGAGRYLLRAPLSEVTMATPPRIQASFVRTSSPRPSVPVGASPQTMIQALVNADNFIDLISVNELSNDVSVLLGRGDGTFEAERHFAVGNAPQMVLAADVNGDRFLDLVTPNESSNDLSVLLGHGDGTFDSQQRFAVGNGPIAVQGVRLNADQRLDLIVANTFSNDVSVLLGNGVGMFAAEQRFSVGDRPRTVQAVDDSGQSFDLNRDGNADLVTPNDFSNDISVLLGRGDGTFEEQQRFFVGSGPTAVLVADVNGDSRIDLVTPNFRSNDVSILLGTGTELLFATEHRVFSGNSPNLFAYYFVGAGPVAVQTVDFNGDHRVDALVTANGFGRNVAVLTHDGQGNFDDVRYYNVGTFPTSVQTADLNGDGREDLVASNEFSNDVSVLLGQADGTFAAERRFSVGASPQMVLAVDVNGDDRCDLVTPNLGHYDSAYLDGSLSVLLSRGDGTFEEQRRLAIGDSGIGFLPGDIETADVNDDGHIDLIAPNGFSNDVSVLLGRGDGTFEEQLRYSISTALFPAFAFTVRAVEVNGDGRDDLITFNLATHDVSVVLGRGDGTFGNVMSFYLDMDLGSVIIVDVNDDGRVDLVGTNASDVRVRFASRDGTFEEPQPLSNGISLESLQLRGFTALESIEHVVDFNGDCTLGEL